MKHKVAWLAGALAGIALIVGLVVAYPNIQWGTGGSNHNPGIGYHLHIPAKDATTTTGAGQ